MPVVECDFQGQTSSAKAEERLSLPALLRLEFAGLEFAGDFEPELDGTAVQRSGGMPWKAAFQSGQSWRDYRRVMRRVLGAESH